VSVEVRDKARRLIGSSRAGSDTFAGSGCVVTFTIRRLPETAFYQIEIGKHGGPSLTFRELEAANWHVEVTLG